MPEPFAFEGPEKQHLAYLANALIGPRVDALIRVGGHQLAEALGDQWSPVAARSLLQDTLTQVVRSITDTITKPGLIGVDFADIHHILQDQGVSFAAVGIASGPRRAERAARQAQAELASRCRFDTAKGVLACITAGLDMAIQEFDEVGNVLRETLSDEANVVLSTVIQPDLPPEQMLVCIVAAGVDTDAVGTESVSFE
jgi:cell division protein FtsZ